MKLTDLQSEFIRLGPPSEEGGRPIESVATLAEAHGLRFKCPLCLDKEKSAYAAPIVVGLAGHGITERDGMGLLWDVQGTDLHDLTLSPSIHQVRGACGCGWHGFVRCGEVTSV